MPTPAARRLVRNFRLLYLLSIAALLLLPLPAFGQTELITNGSFAADSTGWTRSGNFYADHQFTDCHICPGYAYVSNLDGSSGNNLFGTMYQTFTIPSGSASATLSFWYKITTSETGSTGNDVLNVTLQNSSGGFLATVAVLSNLHQSSSYNQITFNLSPYIGQTVRLHFLGTTNSSAPSRFRVDTVSATVSSPPPNPPSNLSVVGSSSTLLMGWNDNSSNESGFKVEWRTGLSGSYSFLGQTGSNATAFQDPSSRAFGNIYCYRVYAFNGSGNSGYSNEDCGTSLATPVLTSPADGQPISGNSVTLQWNPVAQAETYAIDMGSSCGSTSVLNDFATASTSTVVSNLAAGTYYWRARAANSTYSGISAESGCRSFTVSSQTPDIRISPLSLTFSSSSLATAPASRKRAQAPELQPTMNWELVSSLETKARQKGTVRVIVRVDASFIPEGWLEGPLEVERQRNMIRVAQDAVLAGLQGTGAKVLATYGYIPYLALEVDAKVLSSLVALPSVVAIEEDVLLAPSLASSTPVIGAPVAWAAGYDGSGQVVAILDSGVDKTHPFFTTGHNKVVSEACYSGGGGGVSFCPGGVTSSTAPGSGVNCPVSVAGCDHGTHVAGIAAGNDGGGPNFGVARGADVIAIQVFSRHNNAAECSPFGLTAPCALTNYSDVLSGLQRVYALRSSFNIASVNMSLGDGQYSAHCDTANPALKSTIDNLLSAKIATVIATGNAGFTNSMYFPACISSAISVGATDDSDNIASFSNIASFIDLLAPGVSIDSSVPGGVIGGKNGTSMSAPHVAGAWAVYKQKNPSASVDEVLTAFKNTGTLVNDNRSGGTVTSMRRINIDKALGLSQGSGQTFAIFNDGNSTLSITSMQLQTSASWIQWSPQAPFNIAPGGSQQVTVTVDFGSAPAGSSTRRLSVVSNDPDESPYPGGVDIIVNRPSGPTCTSFSVAPPSISPSAASGSQPVTITGSPSGCQGGNWSASGNGSWLTVSPGSGTGSGSVTVSWTQNTSTSSRSGTAAIAGNSFNVNQAGSASPTCTSFFISPTGANPTSASGSQLVTVTGSPSGCQGGSWSASGNGSWLTVSPGSGTGSGSVTVSWTQNTSAPRSGTATIAGNSFNVNQDGSSQDLPLLNGVARTDSVTGGSTQGTWKYYYADVPAGSGNLAVILSGLSADADLYVRFGSKPTLTDFDCRPYLGGTDGEQCNFASPAAGRWWVGINNYDTGTIAYQIVAAWTGATGLSFYTITPCRLVDTRSGPPVSSGIVYGLQVTGSCGIPPSAAAVAANVTVVGATGSGYVTIWPGNLPQPGTSTINFGVGQVRANNAILALATDGFGDVALAPVVTGNGTVHLLLDVSGYFAP